MGCEGAETGVHDFQSCRMSPQNDAASAAGVSFLFVYTVG